MSTVLSVNKLHKKFCKSLKRSLWYGVKDMCKELMLIDNARTSLRKNEFWSLHDISFELKKGETLGIIGHNGSGKSTLLKTINGLLKPDQGSITAHGRIGALIELGTGFNPILSGRENIFVNGTILGLSKKEIKKRMEEIIEFAQIGDFIDSPIKNYSSGMKVRLGFAVASSLNPDILLIDEILSVGDASFRERCYNKITSYKKAGGSIIFVSHNSTAVDTICDKVMVLDKGKIHSMGDPKQMTMVYEARMAKLERQASQKLQEKFNLDKAEEDEDIQVKRVKCIDAQTGHECDSFSIDQELILEIEYKILKEVTNPYFSIGLSKSSPSAAQFTSINMLNDGTHIGKLSNNGSVRCRININSFTPGEYYVHIGIHRSRTAKTGKKHYLRGKNFAAFSICPFAFRDRNPSFPMSSIKTFPPIYSDYRWEITSQGTTQGIE